MAAAQEGPSFPPSISPAECPKPPTKKDFKLLLKSCGHPADEVDGNPYRRFLRNCNSAPAFRCMLYKFVDSAYYFIHNPLPLLAISHTCYWPFFFGACQSLPLQLFAKTYIMLDSLQDEGALPRKDWLMTTFANPGLRKTLFHAFVILTKGYVQDEGEKFNAPLDFEEPYSGNLRLDRFIGAFATANILTAREVPYSFSGLVTMLAITNSYLRNCVIISLTNYFKLYLS